MEKSRKPKIRFKGYNDDWEQRKLGDVVDVRSGKDYKHLSEGNIPVYGTGGFMLSVNQALSYDEDAIGIGRKGTIDKPYILKAPFWTVDTLFYAIPREKVDLNFAFDVFQNIDWKKKDESTGVPSLSKTAINEIDVLVPQYDEQQPLGQFFNRIDNLITLHQRKLEKLMNVKKSMLEKMFPKQGSVVPEIRFCGFTDAWEQRKLGDCIFELKSGLSRMLSEEDIGMPVVRANNIENDKLDMSNNVKYWYVNDPQGVDTLNYTISKNDILINFINSENKMGTAAIVEKMPNRPTIYTTNILKMKLNDKCYNYYFLAYTHTKDYKEYIKGISKIAVNQASFTTVDFKNYCYEMTVVKT